jgi:hypothetical protein
MRTLSELRHPARCRPCGFVFAPRNMHCALLLRPPQPHAQARQPLPIPWRSLHSRCQCTTWQHLCTASIHAWPRLRHAPPAVPTSVQLLQIGSMPPSMLPHALRHHHDTLHVIRRCTSTHQQHHPAAAPPVAAPPAPENARLIHVHERKTRQYTPRSNTRSGLPNNSSNHKSTMMHTLEPQKGWQAEAKQYLLLLQVYREPAPAWTTPVQHMTEQLQH